MERSDYPAMLAALSPSQAVEILNDRVGIVGKLNTEIADWLAERRRIEEVYANSLRKLARRPIQGVDLGIFSVPWSTLANATENQADSHASLASKIEVDVERPLRDFLKDSREHQSLTTTQGNLGALAKEVDMAQTKIGKLQGKGERPGTSKMASAHQELDHAQGQWETQAPYVFENLQALDETRLNHLRDVLTQLQTHEVDQVERDRVSAEQCLNVLLNVEIADEIKTFVLKAVANKPRIERSARQAPLPATPDASAARPTLAPTMSQASANENASQRTDSIQEDEKKKGPLKGLKRLSTVMGRKKDRGSKLPTQLEPMAEAPENKTRFGGFGKKKKDAPGQDAPAESSSLQRPYSPLRIGSEAFEPSELPSNAASSSRQHESVNGIAAAGTATGVGPGAATLSIPNGSHQNDLADLEPPRPEPPVRTGSLPKRDAEGFSTPPDNVDPITRMQQEAAAYGDSGAPQYNVNIRDAPIAEERTADADAALASMASKLQMQAPPPQRRAGTVRGRRDGRNSTLFPSSESPIDQSTSTQASSSTFAAPAQPLNANTSTTSLPMQQPVFDPSASTSSAFSTLPIAAEAASLFKPRALTSDHTGDNQSVRSGRSLASTTSQGHKHPDLTDAGLNVSIIENVSARFEGGKVTSASLVGEVALAYHPADFSTPFGIEIIRLDKFASLEKVAPNQAFVSPAATGRPGDYSLNLAGIGKTQVAFKYQSQLEENGSCAPLLVSTAYRIEPTQSSVIASYSLNPAFAMQATSVTLTNVVLALTLEGARASGCQSKPVGTFSREKNLIFWQIGEITLTRGAAPVKLLARFTTESEAKTGNVEARWEITGEQALSLGSGLAISAQIQPGVTDGADPFADESAQNAQFKPVHTIKKLASGTYTAK